MQGRASHLQATKVSLYLGLILYLFRSCPDNVRMFIIIRVVWPLRRLEVLQDEPAASRRVVKIFPLKKKG
jgi:hypothetical protein